VAGKMMDFNGEQQRQSSTNYQTLAVQIAMLQQWLKLD
jgi:hypothetical protein